MATLTGCCETALRNAPSSLFGTSSWPSMDTVFLHGRNMNH